MAWSKNSKVGGTRVVTRSLGKEEARLHRTLWAMERILDFIPSAMESRWRVLTGEQCYLVYTFQKALCYVEK